MVLGMYGFIYSSLPYWKSKIKDIAVNQQAKRLSLNSPNVLTGVCAKQTWFNLVSLKYFLLQIHVQIICNLWCSTWSSFFGLISALWSPKTCLLLSSTWKYVPLFTEYTGTLSLYTQPLALNQHQAIEWYCHLFPHNSCYICNAEKGYDFLNS